VATIPGYVISVVALLIFLERPIATHRAIGAQASTAVLAARHAGACGNALTQTLDTLILLSRAGPALIAAPVISTFLLLRCRGSGTLEIHSHPIDAQSLRTVSAVSTAAVVAALFADTRPCTNALSRGANSLQPVQTRLALIQFFVLAHAGTPVESARVLVIASFLVHIIVTVIIFPVTNLLSKGRCFRVKW